MGFALVLRRIIFIGCCICAVTLPFRFPLKNINLHLPLISNFITLEIIFFLILWELVIIVERRIMIRGADLAAPILAFFAVHLYSSIFPSDHMVWSLKYTFRLFGMGVIAFVVMNFIDGARQLEDLVHCLIAGAALAAVVVLIQYRWPYLLTGAQRFFEDYNTISPQRVRGFFGWPTTMTAYLGSFIPLAISLSFSRQGRRGAVRRLFYLLFIALIVLCLIASRTRGWIIGLFCGTVTVWLIYALRTRDYASVMIAVSCVVLLVALTVSFFPEFIKFGLGDLELTERDRVEMAKSAIALIKEHPIKGIGADMYYWAHESTGTKVRTHNIFLETMVNTGVFGVLVFLWMMWEILRKIAAGSVRGELTTKVSIQIGILGSLLSFLGHMQVDYFLALYECIGLFWILAGIGLCAARTERA